MTKINHENCLVSPIPWCALSHSHQVPAHRGESHAVHAFSLTPLEILGTLFCTCTEWLENPYVLPLPGPSNGTPYVEKTKKKVRKCKRRPSKGKCTRKVGEIDPFHRTTEGREAR